MCPSQSKSLGCTPAPSAGKDFRVLRKAAHDWTKRKQSRAEPALHESITGHGTKERVLMWGNVYTVKWEKLETRKKGQCDSILHMCAHTPSGRKQTEKEGATMLIFHPGKQESLTTLGVVLFVDFAGLFVCICLYIFNVFSLSMCSFCNRKLGKARETSM